MITKTQNNNFIDSQRNCDLNIFFTSAYLWSYRFRVSVIITLWIIYPVNYMLFFVRGCILTLVFYFIFESDLQVSVIITHWIIYPVNYMLFFVSGCMLTLVFYFYFSVRPTWSISAEPAALLWVSILICSQRVLKHPKYFHDIFPMMSGLK